MFADDGVVLLVAFTKTLTDPALSRQHLGAGFPVVSPASFRHWFVVTCWKLPVGPSQLV